MINQNLKILYTASFFTVSKINALLIILQSLLAPYQLLLYKNVYFYNIVMACLTFASHFIPHFYSISVLWSSPAVEQLIKSEVLMTTTYHFLQFQGSLARFCSVSLPNQDEFNRQNKRNGHYCFCVLHRIIIK